MSMEWKTLTGRFENGQALYLGKFRVATVYWNSGRNRNDPHTHAANIALPGMKKEFCNHVHLSLDDAKQHVEEIVKAWVTRAGLEFK